MWPATSRIKWGSVAFWVESNISVLYLAIKRIISETIESWLCTLLKIILIWEKYYRQLIVGAFAVKRSVRIASLLCEQFLCWFSWKWEYSILTNNMRGWSFAVYSRNDCNVEKFKYRTCFRENTTVRMV